MTRPVNKAHRIVFGQKGPVEGMKNCLSCHFIHSTLVLSYSLIDMMAWLALPEARNEVQREDFVSWTNLYVLPDSGLVCTAEDLYAARCGVIHTMTPESRLSRSGKATKIGYSWGSRKPYPRQKLQSYGLPWVMIHVDTLCEAIEKGAQRFMTDMLSDRKRLKAVNSRARKMLTEDERLPTELP